MIVHPLIISKLNYPELSLLCHSPTHPFSNLSPSFSFHSLPVTHRIWLRITLTFHVVQLDFCLHILTNFQTPPSQPELCLWPFPSLVFESTLHTLEIVWPGFLSSPEILSLLIHPSYTTVLELCTAWNPVWYQINICYRFFFQHSLKILLSF